MALRKKIKKAVNIAALVGFLGGTGTALIIDSKADDYLTSDARETIALENRTESLARTNYELNEVDEHIIVSAQYSQMQEELKANLANPAITASIEEFNDFRSYMRAPVCIAGLSALYGLLCMFGVGRERFPKDEKKDLGRIK
jgi:hypothetical protein